MAMALRTGFLLLSLLSTCGGAPISDESAMLQVAADFTSAEGGSLELDSEEGDPDAAMVRRNIETAFDIYRKKASGDSAVLAGISKQLAQAWMGEVSSQVQNGIKQLLGMQEKMFKKATANVTFNGTKALEDAGKYLKDGGLSSDVLQWVSKMADAQGAMARQLIDKSIDWQKLAAGNLLLSSQKTSVRDPDAAMLRRNVETAIDIYKKKTAGDIAVLSDISKVLAGAWEAEFRRTMKAVRAGTIGKQEEKLMAQKNATSKGNKDMIAAVDQWMKENIKEGKLAWKVLPMIQKLGEQSALAAQQWLDKSIDWQRLAAGAFMQLGQKTKVRSGQPELNLTEVKDVLAKLKSQLKRHAEEKTDEQKKLLAADKVPGQMHQWMTFNIQQGKLDENTVKTIKTFMDNSAALAQKWQAHSIDLQKLISGYFMVQSQHPKIVIDEETKKAFEQVMLQQERMVKQAGKGLEQLGIFKDGKLTPAATARVKAIFDETTEKARQWLAKNVDYQKLAGEAIKHLAQK